MKIDKKKFKIDKNAGVTVCVLDCDYPEISVYSKRFTGITRICEGDTWDEEKGKEIAFLKAYLRARSFERKECNRIGDNCLMEAQSLQRYGQNLKAYADACAGMINDAYSELEMLMFS